MTNFFKTSVEFVILFIWWSFLHILRLKSLTVIWSVSRDSFSSWRKEFVVPNDIITNTQRGLESVTVVSKNIVSRQNKIFVTLKVLYDDVAVIQLDNLFTLLFKFRNLLVATSDVQSVPVLLLNNPREKIIVPNSLETGVPFIQATGIETSVRTICTMSFCHLCFCTAHTPSLLRAPCSIRIYSTSLHILVVGSLTIVWALRRFRTA